MAHFILFFPSTAPRSVQGGAGEGMGGWDRGMQWRGTVKDLTLEEEATDSDCLRTRVRDGPRKGFWRRGGVKSGGVANLVQRIRKIVIQSKGLPNVNQKNITHAFSQQERRPRTHYKIRTTSQRWSHSR